MFCGNCGNQIPDNVKFCPKCGQVTDAGEEEDDGTEAVSSTPRRKSKLPIVAVSIFCSIVIITSIVIGLVMINNNSNSNRDEQLTINEDVIEDIDIGAATRSTCEVLETIDASESTDVMTEKDTVSLFENRGFEASAIVTAYETDGTYSGEQEITFDSETYHPLYSVIYVSPDDYYWLVCCCNGELSASPLSYLLSDASDCEVLISENEYIMSYDSVTNCFYKLIPNAEDCVIKQVSQIDSDMLDSLSTGELKVS